MSIDYADIIKSLYHELIRKYDLDFLEITDDLYALIGWRYALLLGISREGADLYYTMPDNKGEVIAYFCDAYLCRTIDANDRAGIKKSTNLHEHILVELEIELRNLTNHWDSLLKGDKSWIPDCERNGFLPEKVNSVWEEKLKPIFSLQV